MGVSKTRFQKLERIVIAPNSFKGTLTAREAGEGIARGFRKVLPGVKIEVVPLADGGDGTLATLVEGTGGSLLRKRVHDPLGRAIVASWGILGDQRTGVIEMARASGLALLRERQRNPMKASTRGTGELILAALEKGVRRILVGIGGSATNDGGMGMARALGVRFLNKRGREVPEGGAGLQELARIEMGGLDQRVREALIEVACDVRNPLTGRQGAAYVYGPQKGATGRIVRELDKGLRNLARVVRRDLGVEVEKMPGAGAAGGLGAGLVAFCGARLVSGVEMVMEAVGLEEKVKGCDVLITGEGRMDGQTAFGKVPAGVAAVGLRMGVPVVGICGALGEGAKERMPKGMVACFGASEGEMGEAELKRRARGMLERCAERVGRGLKGWQGEEVKDWCMIF